MKQTVAYGARSLSANVRRPLATATPSIGFGCWTNCYDILLAITYLSRQHKEICYHD